MIKVMDVIKATMSEDSKANLEYINEALIALLYKEREEVDYSTGLSITLPNAVTQNEAYPIIKVLMDAGWERVSVVENKTVVIHFPASKYHGK
ncbi:hypothetical protein PHABIO_12 [Pseudomonas phage Phabio]|uniref:Uncharacterized protein n=1 Tax=Pseudomonas phage Phabio TaxID=2006668 RepID=A0A1Y0SY20_9CAUD|nr:hypothetical protein MZD05_gp012 [Pseudomonas phage Phabio]ARV76643.1 hypothetical protein PHABIO_12 [Pseudomonas phage Phabio]